MSVFRRYVRFATFLAVSIVTGSALLVFVHPLRALLLGFDIGAIVFIALMAIMFSRADEGDMRSKAADNDPDQHVLTGIGLMIAGIVLTAVFVELTGTGGRKGVGIAIAAATLLLSWVFSNLLFTLHYAHVWFLQRDDGKDCGGLDFPGEDPTPDYWDFAYYAFVLGMTFQVSDVQVTSARLRRLALFHGQVAFLFNISVIALSVSLVASAIGG